MKTSEIIAIIGPKGIPKDFPGTSGIEAYVENQIPRLIKQGKTVYCYARRWTSLKHPSVYKGARIITLPTVNTTFFDTLSYSLLATIHASLSDATIVWYHGIGPAVFSFIPKLNRKRVYVTVHSLDWQRRKWNRIGQWFLRICENISIRFSDKIYVVSSQLNTYYRNTFNKRTIIDRYTLIRQRPVLPDIIHDKYRLTKNTYVLYLGRFVPEKRIEWLIRGMQNVQGLTLVLSGGSSHSDAYVQKLTTLSSSKNILFTGYVFGKEKNELLSNCKFFVLPSALEGYPVSVSEALSYGKQCLVGDFLASEYPPNSNLIRYFKRDSYEDFTKKLKDLVRAGVNR